MILSYPKLFFQITSDSQPPFHTILHTCQIRNLNSNFQLYQLKLQLKLQLSNRTLLSFKSYTHKLFYNVLYRFVEEFYVLLRYMITSVLVLVDISHLITSGLNFLLKKHIQQKHNMIV